MILSNVFVRVQITNFDFNFAGKKFYDLGNWAADCMKNSSLLDLDWMRVSEIRNYDVKSSVVKRILSFLIVYISIIEMTPKNEFNDVFTQINLNKYIEYVSLSDIFGHLEI